MNLSNPEGWAGVLYPGGNDICFHRLFNIGNDLSHTKEAHNSRNQSHPVAEFEDTKGKTLSAGNSIHSDRAEEEAKDKHH